MRRNIIVFLSCLAVCFGVYRFGETGLEQAKQMGVQQLYIEITEFMFPILHIYEADGKPEIARDITEMINPILAAVDYSETGQDTEKDKGNWSNAKEMDNRETSLPSSEKNSEKIQNTQSQEEYVDESSQVISNDSLTITGIEKKVEVNRTKLQDFDFLRQNFYQVDSSTTVNSSLLNVEKLLGKDLSITTDVKGPQILIYHTHSQESYSDSNGSDPTTSIVAVGDYLTQLLQEKYGLQVIHHTGVYDIPRNSAYSTALPHIEQILEENPTIEVVIDLHRDGVGETIHLVSDVNGKPTAQLMFFNGLSYTTAQGNLDYLENPYIEDNLAFSFQMHLAAEEYYPGLMRKIYLKGYRYNLHLCPKSILVEVGAQTNSFQEALNAMEPLANILAMVLLDES